MQQTQLSFAMQTHASPSTDLQPRYLSVAAIKELSEAKDKSITNKNYVLQITQLKDYEGRANQGQDEKKKASFKFRYVLSDGVSSVKALINEKVLKSMVSLILL